ncbi:MAG: hypothetical protein JW931_05890 [Methanomicrobiaceae archaeon]|nr:hypothetical protein [Methanomicrobiaceae archaeon]
MVPKIAVAVLKLIAVVVIVVGSIFAFRICPPAGPWPMPPWCEGGIDVPNFDSGLHYEEYVYSDLPYITENYEATDRPLVMGMAMQDNWGKITGTGPNGNYITEDNRLYVDSSMERLSAINSELVLITDFATMDEDLNIFSQSRGGAAMIEQGEFNDIASSARANGLETMLITNIYELEPLARHQINCENITEDKIDGLFSEWREQVLYEAGKAESAGFDYFVINPRDIGFFFCEYDSYAVQYWPGIAEDVKKQFSGKIGMWGPSYYFSDYSFDTSDLDFIILDDGITEIVGGASEDVADIESKWTAWFERYRNARESAGDDKEYFAMILMPSYDGAMQGGWVEIFDLSTIYIEGSTENLVRDYKEQALVYEGFFRAVYNSDDPPVDGVISYAYWWTDNMYPDTFFVRNDIVHSIRGKDADHVFAKWGGVFA